MNRQYLGIKFPFTNNNEQGYFTDLNITAKDRVRSELLHLILTPKRQRLRDPEFGTDLIKFIYDQNDSVSWNNVENEIRQTVSKYLPYVTLSNVDIVQDETNPFVLYVKLQFEYQQGNDTIKDSVAVKV